MKKSVSTTMFFILVSLSLSVSVFAQNAIPLNPKVTTGKLANGLTFYILPNQKPEQKVELRLIVNAGSINETDEQQGLAHMCEHMAFNGTTHFKKNEIVSFLQDIGVGFGNDLNANTGFDRTLYILPIPTDKPQNLEKGFQVLEDWAHNVTYLNDDIDAERNIILEESRLGKGANDRMFRKIYPRLFRGSLYSERLPIGLDSIIKNFTYEKIKNYYHDWYRPDLMAVTVVGDITVEKAEEFINKHFAGLTNPENEKERKYAPVPAYAFNDAMIVTDKEATRYSVSIQYSNFVKKPVVTETDFKDYIARSLFTGILNQRLQELTQRPNPPFTYGFGSFGSYARGYDAFSLDAGSGNQNPMNALNALITESERLERFGFTQPELDRAKKNYLNSIENAYNNRDKTESDNLTREIIDYFLDRDAMPGIEKEFDLTKQLIPSISLKDVNDLLELIKGDKTKFVSITGPEAKDNMQLPDSAQVLQAFDLIRKSDIKPYAEKEVAAQLLKSSPKAGKVIARKTDAKLGTTELTLSNGVKVILKKTDFKSDEIILSASRFGGSNAYGIKDKYTAAYLPQVIASMGFGDFTPTDLKKYLAGKTATVATSFSDIKDAFSGNSTVKDFETMLQLLYLRVTSPRKDTALFNSFIQKQKAQYAMLASNPISAFADSAYKVFYNQNPLAPIIVPHADYFEKINVDKALQIYKSHFGDMNGMQFVIVGNVDELTAIPLIEKYIASLPVGNKKFTFSDNKVRYLKGKKNLTVYKGAEEKSFILAMFSGETPYSEELDLQAQAISEVLNIRIIEELREKIQGIYGGGIYGSLEKYPYASFSFTVQLPCGPEKADTLVTALLSEIKKIKTAGIDESYLNKVKLQWKESHKEAIKNNAAWAGNLLSSKVDGDNIDRFVNYEKYVDKLTAADIKKVANLFLNGTNLLMAKLMPAKYKP